MGRERDAYTNEEHDILCFPRCRQIAYQPIGSRLLAIVVGQSRCVFARLVKRYTPIDLRSNVHQRRSSGVTCKVIYSMKPQSLASEEL